MSIIKNKLILNLLKGLATSSVFASCCAILTTSCASQQVANKYIGGTNWSHVVPINGQPLRLTLYINSNVTPITWIKTQATDTIPDFLIIKDDQDQDYNIENPSSQSTYLNFSIDKTKIPFEGIPNTISIWIGVADPNVSPYLIQIPAYSDDKYIETKDGVPAFLDPNNAAQQSLEIKYFDSASSASVPTPIVWYCPNPLANVKMLNTDGSPYDNSEQAAIKFVLDLDKPPQADTQQFTVYAGGSTSEYPSLIIEVLPPRSSIPIFDQYKPSMLVGDSQSLTAKCVGSNGEQVPVDTINVTGNGKDTNWTWNWNSSTKAGTLTYTVDSGQTITLSAVATYQGTSSQTIYIDLVHTPYQQLPVIQRFFTISGSTITGFNADFLTSCASDTTLDKYLTDYGASKFANVLDLSNKHISGDMCALSSVRAGNTNITNFYKRIKRIYLDETVFEKSPASADNIVYTGNCTFGNRYNTDLNDFPNVTMISMKNPDFTTAVQGLSNVSILTAYKLFSHQKFDKLESLTLDGINFAPTNLSITDSSADKYISTASETFDYCKFPVLKELIIKDCKFAVSTMESAGSPPVPPVKIYTFHMTFASCQFDVLDSLVLTNNTFIDTEMSSGDLAIAASSFASCKFPALEELSLANAAFAVKDDAFVWQIDTAPSMFASCDFTALTSIDLATTTFAMVYTPTTPPPIQPIPRWAFSTFASASLKELESVYLPPASLQPDTCGWDQTFVNAIPPDDSGGYFLDTTMYGYDDAPAWFNETWLPGCMWSEN